MLRASSYVLLAALSSGLFSLFQAEFTGHCRRAARVTYPNCYATAAEAATSPEKLRFNCAQRAQANFTEHHSTFLAALLTAGLKYPVAAAALGGTWIFARTFYTLGYARKNPPPNGAGRLIGTWWLLPHFALIVTGAWTTWGLVAEN